MSFDLTRCNASALENCASAKAQLAGAAANNNDMNTQTANLADEINRYDVVNISQGSMQSAQGSEQTAHARRERAPLAANLQTLVARFKVWRANEHATQIH